MPLLSVVVPVFNEEQVLERFSERVFPALEKLDLQVEVLFVDDGSTDASWEKLLRMRERFPRVKLLRFSRNFGHQIAITAGCDACAGDAAVVIDADLQDPPEVIAELVAKWREGFDVVSAVRTEREKETFFKILTAKLFYRMIASMTDVKIAVDAGDFRLMSRRALDSLKRLKERHRFVRGLASWVGFKQSVVHYKRHARAAGETKYPLHKMLKFAIDGIVSFSDKPLRIATYLGFVGSGLSLGLIAYFLAIKLFPEMVPFPPLPNGLTAILVSVFFLGGVQLISLGILGEYLGRLYDEAKARPLYLLSETQGFSAQDDPLGSR